MEHHSFRKDRRDLRWYLITFTYKTYNGNRHYCASGHNKCLQDRIHAPM